MTKVGPQIPRRARNWRAILAAVMITWVNASILLAQVPAKPPGEPPKPVFQWLFAVGTLILCCGIAFKNPKRSHQA